jgi:hypothetical protein
MDIDLIWASDEGKYFFIQDWTRGITLIHFNNHTFHCVEKTIASDDKLDRRKKIAEQMAATGRSGPRAAPSSILATSRFAAMINILFV